MKLLCELQLLQNKETEAKKILKDVNKALLEAKTRFVEAQSKKDKIVKELTEKKDSLQDEDLKLRSLEENIKKHEKELFSEKASNPKFLTELGNKVKELKNFKDKSEEVVLILIDEVDNLERKLSEHEKVLKEAEIELNKKESKFNIEQEETKKMLEEIDLRRKILKEDIKPEYLEAFDKALLIGQGKAISVVERDACGVCKSSIPLNTLQRLKKEPSMLQYCENCGRILCMIE